ncbi:MAG: zinc-ribbon domain-containing protein [Oscillospiraceae bacterium]|jgi:hypothetical protein|nr:zinc-ribbon domain-containing protein [Oscillospiraceae bacterium]
MICQKCGKQNPADSVFCLSCGEKLADTVRSSDGVYFAEDCPVLMTSHSIIKDVTADTVSLQCEFQNLSRKNIVALYISVLCAGIDGGEMQGIDEYVYLDMAVGCGNMFGSDIRISLPNRAARKISITPKKVVFDDGEMWNNDALMLEAIPSISIDVLGNLADTYRRTVPPQRQQCLPQKTETYWQCGCGQVNLPNEPCCILCNTELTSQLESCNTDSLTHLREHYRTIDESEAKIEEENRIETEKAKKLKLRLAFIGICAIAVVIAMFVIFSR